jgi:hypothetical protein
LHNENLLIILTLQQIFSELSKQKDELDKHIVPIGQIRTKFYLGNLNGRDRSGDLGVKGSIILKWIAKIYV